MYCVHFVLLIFFFSGVYSQPQLEIRPHGDSFIRPIDSNIVFTCNVANIGAQLVPIRLQWYNQHGIEIVDVAAPGRRMYVEEDGPSTKKLYIHVAVEHEGTYTCTGVLEGNRQSKTVRLDLYKDITYDAARSPQHPTQYENGLVECRVSGQPIPTVSWRYRGRRITTGGRYTQDIYGLRIENITTADDGIYYCRAEVDTEGRYDERAIEVIVYVQPTMAPGSEQNFEGEQSQQFSLRCNARGKPDPKYVFYKDSNQNAVHSTDRIQVDGDSGTIHFRPLHKDDDGRYRCVAFNDVGETEIELRLVVIVPPTVYVVRNVTGEEGREVTEECLSYGDPAPTMEFRKAGELEPFRMGPNAGGRIVMSNPSDGRLLLVIKNLVPSDTSNYTCISRNQAGMHERNGTITVNHKPRFASNRTAAVYAWAGKTRNITCHIIAEPLPVIEWYHHDQRLVNNETYRIYIMSKDTNLQVTVREVDEGWIYGEFMCVGRNQYGVGQLPITLSRAYAPDRPSVSLGYRSATIISLVVTPPKADGGSPLLGYHVYYDQGRVLSFDLGKEVLIENLHPSTTYAFQVRAINEVGVGAPTQFMTTTGDVRAPSRPVITSEALGSSAYEFEVTWEKPETGGMPIVEYEFRLRKIRGPPGISGVEAVGGWVSRRREESPDIPVLYYILQNLDSQTWYQLEMKARNSIGWSQPNDLFCFRTAEGDLPPPGPVVDRGSSVYPVARAVYVMWIVAMVNVAL